MARKSLSKVRDRTICQVTSRPGNPQQGLLRIDATFFSCALGRGGTAALKCEGDGVTPIGRWQLREVFYRPDRVPCPRTRLPVRPLRPSDGWCEDPGDRNYNKPVRLPYTASTESMWREDHLYDVVVVIGYNDLPRRRGRGSAIFMHLARTGFQPTEGCVALQPRDLARVLSMCRPGSAIEIKA